uniref:Cysteine-rich receptor-like protein kinase 11 n=1 Tax=Aegilops tauschii TaxID=37682 RepID=M8BDZ1_AEGTA
MGNLEISTGNQNLAWDAAIKCPGQKKSTLFYDACLLRHSNVSFFGVANMSWLTGLCNAVNATQPELFKTQLGALMNNLSSRAAAPELKVETATELEDRTVSMEETMGSSESLLYDLSTLRAAIDNFSEENKLGEGGFGPVYKGILRDGQEIAVKRLSKNSKQGLVEMRNEVVLVAKLQHKNLVRLLGCCIQEEEMLLVYEFLFNRSLDKILFGRYLVLQTVILQVTFSFKSLDPARQQELTWGHRFRIIQGIGRGLLYLHEDSRQDWDVHSSVQFEGFGLRSGTVILYVGRVGLIRLNLATKEAVVVYHRSDTAYISQFATTALAAARICMGGATEADGAPIKKIDVEISSPTTDRSPCSAG